MDEDQTSTGRVDAAEAVSTPVPTPVGERVHQVHWFAGRLGEVLDGLLGPGGEAGLGLSLLDVEQTAETVLEVDRAIARLQGLTAALLAHAEVIDVAAHATPVATTTGGWFAHATRTPRPAAARTVKQALRLAGERHATGTALRAGACDAAQATVIVTAVDALPEQVGPELRARAEAHLLDLATVHDAEELKRLARHLHEVIDPEGAEDALAAQLAAEEEAARAATRCTIRDTANGRTRAVIDMPRLDGDLLRSMLHAFESPKRPCHQSGDQSSDRSSDGASDTDQTRGKRGRRRGKRRSKKADAGTAQVDAQAAAQGSPVRDDGFVDDPTTPGKRISRDEARGRAFCELLERLPAAALPGSGGSPFTVVVTMTLKSLLGGLAPGVLDTGTLISAGEARRLAAEHGVIPVVLGTRSEVLDVGRRARLHTKAMRTALRVQHRTCTVQGCTVPAAWCHAHHTQQWASGGHTNVEDGTLVCGPHHRKIHHPAYTATYDPGGTTHLTRTRR